SVLALAISSLASAAMAQTAPSAPAPATQEDQAAALAAQLDLPRDLKLFGKADPNIRKPTAIVNDTVLTGTDVDQRLNLIIALNKL
ncbi:peptidylprolyl isomerase, partial [Escherichia coli]|nr:peptidylprolyl isomerase [Escherichia coli]